MESQYLSETPNGTLVDGRDLDDVNSSERPSHTKLKMRERPADFSAIQIPCSQIFGVEIEKNSGSINSDSKYSSSTLADHVDSFTVGSSPSHEIFQLPELSSMIADIKKDHIPSMDTAEVADKLFSKLLALASNGKLSYPELLELYGTSSRFLGDMVREEAGLQDRPGDGDFLRQKSNMLHSEAATWSLLWHLLCQEDESVAGTYLLNPPPSQECAGQFLAENTSANRILRIVQWLESLASLSLDREEQQNGSSVGKYTQKNGSWRATLCAVRCRQTGLPTHMDPDASIREDASLHPEDEKEEIALMTDLWRLIQAGCLGKARQLCRSAGQFWRAVTLGGCGDEGPSPPLANWVRSGRAKELQALEMEHERRVHQRFLWKGLCYSLSEKVSQSRVGIAYEAAVYAAMCSNVRRMLPVCTSWEEACWALARAWLDEQVDSHLAHLDKKTEFGPRREKLRNNRALSSTPQAAASVVNEWPKAVREQQPTDMLDFCRRLQSSELVSEVVRNSCKETHRVLQMQLMRLDLLEMLDKLRTLSLKPPHDKSPRSAAESHIARVAAHLVLLLRALHSSNLQVTERDSLERVGDIIIYSYAMQLITSKPELVALYASKLSPLLGRDLYSCLLELKKDESLAVRETIIRAALEHLPLHDKDNSVLSILDEAVESSCKLRPTARNRPFYDHMESEELRRVNAIQWFCLELKREHQRFTLAHFEMCTRAIFYSIVLFRQLALAAVSGQFRRPTAALKLAEIMKPQVREHASELGANLTPIQAAVLQTNNSELESWQEYVTFEASYHQWVEATKQSSHGDAVHAARQALAARPKALQGATATWLPDSSESEFEGKPDLLELHIQGPLLGRDRLPVPLDTNMCASFANALQHFVDAEVISERRLKVDVAMSPVGPYMDIVLRCLPAPGDACGPDAHPAGGLLAAIIAAAIKGSLPTWHPGTTLMALSMKANAIFGAAPVPNRSILIGLVRLCSLPVLVFHCMELRIFLAQTVGLPEDDSGDLAQIVAGPSSSLEQFFSGQQLAALLAGEKDAQLFSKFLQDKNRMATAAAW